MPCFQVVSFVCCFVFLSEWGTKKIFLCFLEYFIPTFRLHQHIVAHCALCTLCIARTTHSTRRSTQCTLHTVHTHFVLCALPTLPLHIVHSALHCNCARKCVPLFPAGHRNRKKRANRCSVRGDLSANRRPLEATAVDAKPKLVPGSRRGPRDEARRQHGASHSSSSDGSTSPFGPMRCITSSSSLNDTSGLFARMVPPIAYLSTKDSKSVRIVAQAAMISTAMHCVNNYHGGWGAGGAKRGKGREGGLDGQMMG